jgi:GNAT superfamily N-acetyltransferase
MKTLQNCQSQARELLLFDRNPGGTLVPAPTMFNDVKNHFLRGGNSYPLISSCARRYWCREEIAEAGTTHLSINYCSQEIAYGCSHQCMNDSEWHIDDLYIADTHRWDGLGRMLLMRTVRIALDRGAKFMVCPINRDKLDNTVDDERNVVQWYADFGFKVLPTGEPNRMVSLRCDLTPFERCCNDGRS